MMKTINPPLMMMMVVTLFLCFYFGYSSMFVHILVKSFCTYTYNTLKLVLVVDNKNK